MLSHWNRVKKMGIKSFTRSKYVFINLIFALIALFYLIYEYNSYNQAVLLLNNTQIRKTYSLKSECSCRKDILVKQYDIDENLYEINNNLIYFNSKQEINENTRKFLDSTRKYNKNIKQIFINPKFTCDLYNTFRHGPNQKVISYAFYGTNYGYFNLLELIAETALTLFPGWILRVHHDNLINKTRLCEMECKFDTVYFCNINQVPFKTIDNINVLDMNKPAEKYDLGYIHGMMWRWFPISDDFVDYFSSRDTDSTLIQREKDSVEAWLIQKKLFHIMRDNPYHNTVILGGY